MINLNCPKCGKHYELDDNLKGKEGRCTCGKIFIITEVVELRSQITLTPSNYLSEALEFMKENFLSIFGMVFVVSLIFNIASVLITKYNSNLTIIDSIIQGLLITGFSLIYINYVYKKQTDITYKIKQSAKEGLSKIIGAIVINILMGLVYFACMLPLIIGIGLVAIGGASSFSNGGKEISAIMIIGLVVCLFGLAGVVFGILLILKYSFAYQNMLILKLNGWEAIKKSSEQTVGLRLKIFLIHLSIYGLLFGIAILTGIIFGLAGGVNEEIINIFIGILTNLLQVISVIIVTKLYINITGTNLKIQPKIEEEVTI